MDRDDDESVFANDSSTGIGSLPDEILEFVLTYLPPYKDLERCSLVCKRWHVAVKNLIRRSQMNLHKGLNDFRLQWSCRAAAPTLEAPNANMPNTPFSTIAGRFSHSAVRHGNYMFVFGGGSSEDTTFNDLWRFDLSKMQWERPLSMGSYPSPKGSASMVCWREQLVVFGGWRYPSLYPPYQQWYLFDELHYYELATNRWTVHVTLPSPPPMAGHSASVHGNRMVIFGGYQVSEGINCNSNEVWYLDMQERMWWQPHIVGTTKPPPRYGQYQIELDEQHLLIMGGCGGANSIYSDAWLLDMTRDDGWVWKSIPVRNKKYGATHMWCNPSCKVGSKLVILGPTPNMPQDFQMMRQARVVGHAHNNPFDRPRQVIADGFGLGGAGAAGINAPQLAQHRLENLRMGGRAGMRVLPAPAANAPDDQYYANRRAILNQHQHNNQNFFNNSNNNGAPVSHSNNNYHHNSQPRCGRLSDVHSRNNPTSAVRNEDQNRPSSSTARSNGISASDSTPDNTSTSQNGVTCNGNSVTSNANNKELEAANRLQRNLALRCRENEPILPKRFDELYEDPFRMAAFNVQSRSPRSSSKDHNERIRRMEEKMNAIRNSRRNANAVSEPKIIKEPSPKRVKLNVFSLFVCDLSSALSANDPYVEWIECKNGGVLPGAPERLILSSMVAGNGELILFGGVHKETLGEVTHQVSNAVHFLGAMRDIV